MEVRTIDKMKLEELVAATVSKMKALGVEDDRIHMERYMKNQFDFFGVKSPARKQVQKELRPYIKNLSLDELFLYAEMLWAQPQRELQYVALDALDSKRNKWTPKYLPQIENLILSKSWWDTVDGLAPNIAGSIFLRYPDKKMKWVEKWNNNENMWLNRSAILHQLRYKEDVDLDMLFALVESHIGSKEFFINKASGWALRQASKFYPSEIRVFIQNHPNLSNLTKREGGKYV
ncbi:MAG: DNA alkylation repair protein [Saprospiraceae bacterium]|nr:DNA alkylation repair protein [Saprospiraceae bacterium]